MLNERQVERLLSAYYAKGRLTRAEQAIRDVRWIEGQQKHGVEWPATHAMLKQRIVESCQDAVSAMSACMGTPSLTGLQPVINGVIMTSKEANARLHRAFVRVAQVIKRLEGYNDE